MVRFALPTDPRRRTLLAALTAAALLPACGESRPRFNGIDVTGVDYGRVLQLADPDGKLRSLADFHGKAVLLFFGFTQCPDVCPTALARAVAVRQKLGADAGRVQVLFVTVDPERDTPALLRAYTQAFDPSFIGLRGNEEETAAAAKEFRVIYRKVPTGSTYTMDHTALTCVFDPSGRLRLALRHEQSADQVADDLHILLQSASSIPTKESS